MFFWIDWFLELLGIRHKKEEPVQTVPVPHPVVPKEEPVTTLVLEDPIVVEEKVEEEPDLNTMTKAKIKEYAASKGVELDTKMKKAEMIEAYNNSKK
jgi:hypothetical protein